MYTCVVRDNGFRSRRWSSSVVAAVRKQILLDTAQNKRLKRLRAATGISESEIVRRALAAYDPEDARGLEADPEIAELLAALVAQNAKTAQALELAESEIAATEGYLARARAERKQPKRRARRVAAKKRAAKKRALKKPAARKKVPKSRVKK